MSISQARRDLPFNKVVLKWARIRSGRSYGQAAHSAGVAPAKIIAWEKREATARPTVRQARLWAIAANASSSRRYG